MLSCGPMRLEVSSSLQAHFYVVGVEESETFLPLSAPPARD